jgi:hypothetical protein
MNITEYPLYGENPRKELSVRTRPGVEFSGKAAVVLHGRLPVVFFFEENKTDPRLRVTFGNLLKASDTIDDILGMEIFDAPSVSQIGFTLLGSGGYASTRSIARTDRGIVHIPAH